MTQYYDHVNDAIKPMINQLGNKIVIATPLGLGKPVRFLNAIYDYAKNHPEIDLTILTALSFVKPSAENNFLANRFLEPIQKRLYGNYVDLSYELDRRKNVLAKNVRVIEFYLTPGEYLGNNNAQQNYLYSNYTDVVRDSLFYEINIIAQLIATSPDEPDNFSLSCNPDITPELWYATKEIYPPNKIPILVGEINPNLPYLYGLNAQVEKNAFHTVIQCKASTLFVVPRAEISPADCMIGLHSSILIKDNGCLQIGIGRYADALVQALILRQKNNSLYQKLLENCLINQKYQSIIENEGDIKPFAKGIFASSEMLVDGFLDLYNHGILKKQVFDDCVIQQLLNEELIGTQVTEDVLTLLVERERIAPQLNAHDFYFLLYFGIFKEGVYYHDGYIYFHENDRVRADLSKKRYKDKIVKYCLGSTLKNGRVLHAGFFIGSSSLYEKLRNYSKQERMQFDMRCIQKINQLYHSELIDRLQRKHARFVNGCMKVTLLGAVVSDSLDDGQTVSGVGGQYNFVAMAHALSGARSIINCRSTYEKNGKIKSNIVWQSSAITIPRHLRDIVVTEYGIADCRGKTDAQVIKALLNIADSRFQSELLKQAKDAGKIEKSYQIPALYRENFPENIASRVKSIYEPYPFGSEFTAEELHLKKVLTYLSQRGKVGLVFLVLKGMFSQKKSYDRFLKRMQLDRPNTIKERVHSWLLLGALSSGANYCAPTFN